MLKTKASLGNISAGQLALVLFVSRVSVSLTNIQSVSVGTFAPDILVSFVLSYFFVILFCLPIILCIKKGQSPLKNKGIAIFYGIYFLFYCSVNILRFSYFAATRMTPQLSMVFIIISLSISMLYGAYMGLEAIARFGSFCAVLLVLVMLVVLCLNLDSVNLLNLYPVMVNSRQNVLTNSLLFASNTIEPAVALALSSRVNGDASKALIKGVSWAFLLVFVLLFFVVAVLGGSANMQAFPIFSLFQIASFMAFSRIDIIHTSFWTLAVFMKCSLLVYCASSMTQKYSKKLKCVAISVVSFVVCLIILNTLGTSMITPIKYATILLFALLVIIMPILYLLSVRRSYDKED